MSDNFKLKVQIGNSIKAVWNPDSEFELQPRQLKNCILIMILADRLCKKLLRVLRRDVERRSANSRL